MDWRNAVIHLKQVMAELEVQRECLRLAMVKRSYPKLDPIKKLIEGLNVTVGDLTFEILKAGVTPEMLKEELYR